jgi:hypothetical protein
LTSGKAEPYLKYALFCRDTEEGPKGELFLKDIVDLIDLPAPKDPPEDGIPVIGKVDLNLAFCIAGASPGKHHLMVAIKGPGIPLEPPPAQSLNWEEGIIFQRWIKAFRIPVQRPGLHVAAIMLDGIPLGEASFLIRLDRAGNTGGTAAAAPTS